MKYLSLLAIPAAVAAMMMPQTAAAQADPVLYGYQGDMYGMRDRGMYVMTPTGTTADLLWRDPLAYRSDGSLSTVNMLGGWIRNGRLCGYMSYYPTPSQDYYLYVERDLDTGEVLLQKNIDMRNGWGNYFLYSTYCPTDDRVYGYGYNNTRTAIVFKSAPASDLDQAVMIKRVNFDEMAPSLCFNEELGILVGITSEFEMVQIDVNTGDQTFLYAPELNPTPDYTVTSGLMWVPSRQAYVWNFYTASQITNISNLLEINPEKRTTKTLRSFPAETNFNYFVSQDNNIVVADNAPEAVTGLKASFADDSETGTLTFTLPAKLNNGTAISGDVNYAVWTDGKEMQTGSGAPGSTVTINDFKLDRGTHYVRVLPETDGNKGVAQLVAVYVGNDTPLAPVNVVLTDTKLTWDPVTKGLHGGALEGVTYKITVNGREIDTTSESSYDMADVIDPADKMAAYTAEVVAECKGLSSKAGLSNKIIAGQPYSVPFTIEPTQEEFDLCTQEDTDGNNVGWSIDLREDDSETYLTSGFDRDMVTEDWIFLPKFKVEANGIYEFSTYACLAQEDLRGSTFEVWVGTEPVSDKMTKCIIPTMAFSEYDPLILNGTFMADGELATADVLYIGIGVKSEQGSLSPMQFRGMSLEKSETVMNGPVAVSSLKAEALRDNPRTVHVSYTLPDRTLSGESIPATHKISTKVHVAGGMSATLTGAPGESVETDLEAGQGDFLVTVTPTSGGNVGMPANIVAHLGYGLPGAVRNLRVAYDETNTHMTILWDAPATDMNGTPCEGDYFTYNIWALNEASGRYELQVTVPYPLTYATMDMSGNFPLTNLEVGVTAVSPAGESPIFSRIWCQVGTPYTLPISDDLNGDEFSYKPMTMFANDEYALATVRWGSPAKLGLGDAMATGDVGDVLAGIPTAEGAKSRIVFPKFSTEGCDGVTLNLNIWTGENAAVTTIGATAYPMEEERLLRTVPSGNGYELYKAYLPADMVNNPWVSLSLNVEYPSVRSRFVLAGYSIEKATGVEGVTETVFGTINGGTGRIAFTGYEGCVANIYTLDGRLALSHRLASAADVVTMAPGIYIVKVADRTVKTIVR